MATTDVGLPVATEEILEREGPRAPAPQRNVLDHAPDPEVVFGLLDAPRDRAEEWHHPLDLVDVPAEALRPGLLWRLFKSGARAIRVFDDAAVPMLWHDLMPPSAEARETVHGEVLPWVGSLRSIARNHHPSECVGKLLGDVVFAQPPVLTYIARKMELAAKAGTNELILSPGVFDQDGRLFQLPANTVLSVWELGKKLLDALSPPGWRLEEPALALERLMYDASQEDLRQRVLLTRTALGRWGQLGHSVDEYWAEASGAFQKRGLRTVYSLGRLFPKLGAALERLNRNQRAQSPELKLPAGAAVFGEPHTDARLFSCLTSRRDAIRTEYFAVDGWRELPLTDDSLVIFPGTLARETVGLRPTLHRVVHTGGPSLSGINATILLGFSPRDA